ncbi:MAG: hypothetical protein GXZ09_05855 [Syntrophomonadaceae bacterium]|jgi:hypothetical protein|nr:hypothetical protein [Syntrophomonadaceae bacterium]
MKDIICIDSLEKWTGSTPYHPDDISYAYVTTELVTEIAKQVRAKMGNSPTINEVLEYIQFHEEVHRQLLLAEPVSELIKLKVDQWAREYRNHKGKWIHQEPAYEEFYRLLNRGNW